MGSAQTGTGKTAAFVLPILHQLLQRKPTKKSIGPRCLVVAPTRELAQQVEKDVTAFSKFIKCPQWVFGRRRGLWPADSNAQTSGRCLDCDSGTIAGSHGARPSGFFALDFWYWMKPIACWTWGSLAIYEELWLRSPNSDRPCCFPRRWKDRCCEWPNPSSRILSPFSLTSNVKQHEQISQRIHWADDATHKHHLLAHYVKTEDVTQAVISTATKRRRRMRLVSHLQRQGNEVAVCTW